MLGEIANSLLRLAAMPHLTSKDVRALLQRAWLKVTRTTVSRSREAGASRRAFAYARC